MPGFCTSNCLMSSSTSVTLLWKKYCQYVMVTGCCPAPIPDKVRNMIAAVTTARVVLTTPPPDTDTPSFVGVEHAFLSLQVAAFLSLRGPQGRSNLLVRRSPRAFGARDDGRAVIARPRSGRSNLLLTQDDPIGLLLLQNQVSC